MLPSNWPSDLICSPNNAFNAVYALWIRGEILFVFAYKPDEEEKKNTEKNSSGFMSYIYLVNGRQNYRYFIL